MIGAQASNDQLEKILSYLEIGKAEGAKVLTGGERADLGGDLSGGYYVTPTIFEGNNSHAHLPGGDLRPGAGPDPVLRRGRRAQDRQRHAVRPRRGRLDPGRRPGPTGPAARSRPGRVWTNCYHAYPAHAAFGGYKQSGVGRENHKMMLDHYQQTKNLLVSYSPKKLGFF